MRIALGVEYDGSEFRGWQRQTHDPLTVQETLEKALSKVADHEVSVVCAGRTDSGVHASQQVVHFDSDSIRDEKAWTFGTNTNLPYTVAVTWAKPVDENFHARFSAQERSYRYLIYNSPVRQALLSKQVTWNYRKLDLERMRIAAQPLIGEHDFTSYRAVACQAKNPVRQVKRLELNRVGDMIVLDITANGFLQHMVRNVAGVLMAIGEGSYPTDWSKEVLEAKDRTQGGVTAPPYGLYFVGVGYPEEYVLPKASLPIPVLPFG